MKLYVEDLLNIMTQFAREGKEGDGYHELTFEAGTIIVQDKTENFLAEASSLYNDLKEENDGGFSFYEIHTRASLLVHPDGVEKLRRVLVVDEERQIEWDKLRKVKDGDAELYYIPNASLRYLICGEDYSRIYPSANGIDHLYINLVDIDRRGLYDE